LADKYECVIRGGNDAERQREKRSWIRGSGKINEVVDCVITLSLIHFILFY